MHTEDVLKYGHLTVLNTIENLPASAWDTPDVCGWWSSRQILAHLTSFEVMLVDALDLFLENEPGPTFQMMGEVGGEIFNEKQVAARDGMTAQEILEEYNAAFKAVQDRLKQIPVEKRRQTGAIPWYGQAYDLEDMLAYMYYGHKREHTAQINIFLDKFNN